MKEMAMSYVIEGFENGTWSWEIANPCLSIEEATIDSLEEAISLARNSRQWCGETPCRVTARVPETSLGQL